MNVDPRAASVAYRRPLLGAIPAFAVLTTFAPSGTAAEPPDLSAGPPRTDGEANPRTPLPGLDAVTVDTGSTTFWQAATAAGDLLSSRTLAPSLAAVDQIWFDDLLEVTLDESVPVIGAPEARNFTFSSTERPAISADGRYVGFPGGATILVADDTNGEWDVFVHDRELRTTTESDIFVRDRGQE